MKPNYKESAKIYRKLYYDTYNQVGELQMVQREITAHLTEQKIELNELKIKYSEALDKIIELQEKMRGGEK